MTKQEYLAKRDDIYRQLAELKKQYIKENTDIEPGTLVMAAGQKCYLKDWKVTDGEIYPVLQKMKKDGTMHSSDKIYVSKNAKIVRV